MKRSSRISMRLILLGIGVLLMVSFGTARDTRVAAQNAGPQITATLTESDGGGLELVNDVDNDGQADPGDTLRYTAVITNTGDEDAANVVFNDLLPDGASLDPNTIKVSPIAIDDLFAVEQGTQQVLAVLTNDTNADEDNATWRGSATITIITPPALGTAVVTGNTVTYTHTSADANAVNDSFTYTVTDVDGLVSSEAVASIVIGDLAPMIVTTDPAADAGQIERDTDIVITFSEPVELAGAWFSVTCDGNPIDTTNWTVNSVIQDGQEIVTITPDGLFPEGATCTMVINAFDGMDGVHDSDTNDPPDALVGDADFTFTFLIDIAPSVVSTIPADNATNAAVDQAIAVTFSEAVDDIGTWYSAICNSVPIDTSAWTDDGGVMNGLQETITIQATNLTQNANCTITILAYDNTDGVRDTDLGDPPDAMSADYSFSFDVQPGASDDLYPQTILGNVPVNTAGAPAFSVLTNDTPSSGVTFTVGNGSQSANGGPVAIAPDGTFTYEPPVGFIGTDTFTYTITSVFGTSDPATVTLQVGPQVVWFIDNTPPTASDNLGTLLDPYPSIAAFMADNTGGSGNPDNNHIIFIYESGTAYTGPLTLRDGQKLVGQDSSETLIAAAAISPAPVHSTLPATNTGGDTVLIQNPGGSSANGIIVRNNNTVKGLTVGDTGGVDLSETEVSTFGALLLGDLIFSGTGAALNLSDGTVNGTILSITSTTASQTAINLIDIAGALTVSGSTSLTDIMGAGIVLSSGSADITFNATSITNASSTGIIIGARLSGADSIFGATTVNEGFAGNNASGVTINSIAGPVTFASLGITTNNATALFAQNNSTLITVTNNTGAIVARGGMALNIEDSTVNLNFASTEVTNNPAQGVRLDNVAGTLNLGGNGTNGINGGAGNHAFNVVTGSPTVTYTGTVTQTNALQRVVSIDATTGGSVSLGTVVGTGLSEGVNILNAAGNVTLTTLNLGGSGGVCGTRYSHNGVEVSGGPSTATYNLGNVTICTIGQDVTGIVATDFDGTLATTSGLIDTSQGTTLDIDGPASLTALNITLTTLNASSAFDVGLDLREISGTAALGNGSITDSGGTAFRVHTSSANLIYDGTITQNTANQHVIEITDQTSGKIDFNGTVTAGSTNFSTRGVNVINANGEVEFTTLNVGSVSASVCALRITNQAVSITNGASTGEVDLGTVALCTTGTTGIEATNFDGTIRTTAGLIDAQGDSALDIQGPAGLTELAMTLTTVNTTGDAVGGVLLKNTDGTANLGTGDITNSVGINFIVDGGSPVVTYGGTISQALNAQYVTEIKNTLVGTSVTFTGAVSSGTTLVGPQGIHLDNADGTVTYTTLTLGSSTFPMTTPPVTVENTPSTLVNAVYDLGTVNIWSSGVDGIGVNNFPGTLKTTAGTVNTTGSEAIEIDSGDSFSLRTKLQMTLTTVNASGGTHGIRLDQINLVAELGGTIPPPELSPYYFRVIGTGSAGSGGTITNTTSTGIDLFTAFTTSFKYMTISNTGDDGVGSFNAWHFEFTNSTITNAGNGPGDHGIGFDNPFSENLIGVVNIANNVITSPFSAGIRLHNSGDTLSEWTITGNQITGSVGRTTYGIYVSADRLGDNIIATITGNTIDTTSNDGIRAEVNSFTPGQSPQLIALILDNDVSNTTGVGVIGMVFGPETTGRLDIQFEDNTVSEPTAAGPGSSFASGPGTICLDVQDSDPGDGTNNNSVGNPAPGVGYQLTQSNPGVFLLEGYAGGSVPTFFTSQNNIGTVNAAGTFVGGICDMSVSSPPLMAAGGQASVSQAVDPLTPPQLPAIAAEAAARWAAAGVDVAQLAMVTALPIHITDLPDGMLGLASSNRIELDAAGAGYGWYVDQTPADDTEFTTGLVHGQMDLLTVLSHEYGHVLGYGHDTDDGVLMAEALATGTRNTPSGAPAAPISNGKHQFTAAKPALEPPAALSSFPVNLATLPQGDRVIVQFDVLIDTPFPAGQDELSNQATITYNAPGSPGQTLTAQTDDPETAAPNDPTVTPIDTALGLALAKSDGGVTTAPGDTLTYTLTYGNNGDQDASGVVLTETVPDHTTVHPDSVIAGWVCTGINPGETCTFALNTVAGGDSGSVDFILSLAATIPQDVAEISNTATIDDDGTGGEDGFAQSSDTTPITNVPPPPPDALAISKAFGDTALDVGDTTALTFTLTSPAGQPALTNLSFTDNLPDGLEYVGTPDATQCNGTVTLAGGDSLTFSGGSLDAGPDTCQITVTVRADGDETGTLQNVTSLLTSGEGATSDEPARANVRVDEDDGGGEDDDGDEPSPPAAPAQPLQNFFCTNLAAQTNNAMTSQGGQGNVRLNDLIGDTYCHVIAMDSQYVTNPGEIGNLDLIQMGVVQAVDMFGLVPGGIPVVPFQTPVQVCLRGTGTVFFISSLDNTVEPIPASQNGGYLCASIPVSGKLVLAGGSANPGAVPPQSSAPSAPPAPAGTTALANCTVTTTNMVRLRSTPDTSIDTNILTTLPFETTLTATERIPDWYRVIYGTGQGYVHQDFVTPGESC